MKILLIEDNPGDARLIQEMLAQVPGRPFLLECADRLSAALERISQGSIDVLLVDLSLPDSHGFDTFLKVQAQAPRAAKILLTGLDDEELALQAIEQGAQDYLVKGRVDSNLLVRTLRYAVERQRLLTELEESKQQQLQLKDQFLSHVSHELRSPLAAIHGFTEILLDGLAGDLKPEQREYLQITLKNVHQLRKMIEDLLMVTRAKAGKIVTNRSCVSLGQLIADTLSTLSLAAGAKGITVSSEVTASKLPPAYADPDRVRQVLSNLIDNAIKYTPEGGEVTVAAAVVKEEADFIRVAVADTGSGISAEHAPLVFERLYQAAESLDSSRKGLGLGLHIAKELVTAQGGRIWLESKIGAGSTFFFTLPIFSLAGLLAPILVPENLRDGSISLIAIELFPAGKTSSGTGGQCALDLAREALKRCIVPQTHLVLPNLFGTDAERTLFALACANKAKAKTLVGRIRKELVPTQDSPLFGYDPRISLMQLDIPPIQQDQSWEQLVSDVAARIEQAVQAHVEGKKTSDEREENSYC
jgi:signal transduction histidine kinase